MSKAKPSEIDELKQQILALTKRVSDLENMLSDNFDIGSNWQAEAEAAVPMSRSVVPEPAGVPVVETAVIESLTDFPKVEPISQDIVEPIPEPIAQPIPELIETKKAESLESRIGLYWLNRLGIGSLVIGIALFIIYSFQTWGAGVKIAMGVLAGLALIAGGEWFEQNRDKDPSDARSRYWGLGLIGGGWSVLYFTAFASYHIADVKLLNNLLVEELLLTGLCAGALWHACERRSQTIATSAVMLSFATIAFSQISAASLCWILAIAGGAYALSVFKQWPALLMWTTIGGYATYFLIISPKMPATSSGNPWAVETLGCLSLFWIICNAALYAMKEENDDSKGRLVAATGFNGMSYAFVGTQILTYLQAQVEFNYLMPLLTGVFYGASFQVARKRKQPSLANMHLIMGLTLLTLTIPMICHSKSWFNAFWLLELAVLVYTGLKYELVAVRWFAALLSITCFFSTITAILTTNESIALSVRYSESFLHAMLATAVYGVCARMYRQCKGKVHPSGQLLYLIGFLFFSWLAPIIGSAFIFPDAKHLSLSCTILTWLALYSGFIWYGHKFDEKILRQAAKAGFLCLGLASFILEKQVAFVQVLVAIGFAGAALYTHMQKVTDEKEAKSSYNFYITFGAFLAWCHTLDFAGSGMELLALRWAGEAAVVVGIGHFLRSRYTRILGAIWFLNVFVVLLFQIGKWNGIEDAFVVLLLYLMGFTYRKVPLEYQIGNERRIAHYYEACATTLATMAIWSLVPAEWLTIAFSLEAIILLSAGFMMPDKALRISGLLVFALLGFKLLFVDLATARTDARILSFIGAGIILLGASYIYAKYAQRLLKEDKNN